MSEVKNSTDTPQQAKARQALYRAHALIGQFAIAEPEYFNPVNILRSVKEIIAEAEVAQEAATA